VHALYEQVEYMGKALQTEAHLEKALATVQQYKKYTEARNLRSDWKTFKKKGSEEALATTSIIVQSLAIDKSAAHKLAQKAHEHTAHKHASETSGENGDQTNPSHKEPPPSLLGKTKEDEYLEEIRSLKERLQAEQDNAKKLQESEAKLQKQVQEIVSVCF